MLKFIIRRLFLMIITLILISIVSFAIIQAPPGDFVTSLVAKMEESGISVSQSELENLRYHYGVDKPMYVQYIKWAQGILHGNLGYSMSFEKAVTPIIVERLPWSFALSLLSLIFVYIVAIPIGVMSATHQYSIRDYIFTFIGFIGIAIPNFLFALVILWVYYVYTGNVTVGLFSQIYYHQPWSFAKFWDFLKHLWIPVIVIGTAGTCGLIRVMRANLLDELQKPYVMVARSKGLPARKVLYKYPFRIAINPIVSTIGWTLPALINGELLTSLVLGIPTLAPVLLTSLLNQDMALAGSIILVLSTLTVIGTFISDILLSILDPRIRESV